MSGAGRKVSRSERQPGLTVCESGGQRDYRQALRRTHDRRQDTIKASGVTPAASVKVWERGGWQQLAIVFAGLLALSYGLAQARDATVSTLAPPEKSTEPPECPSEEAMETPAEEAAAKATPTPAREEVPSSEQPSISSSIPVLRDSKKALLACGYNFQLNYTGEVFSNPVGGARQGTAYAGLLEMAVDGDLAKIAGLNGATFHINAYQIHGRGLSAYNVFPLTTISSIEARPTTRLYEAWFEQKRFGGMASIRIGQLAADSEFFISDYELLYLSVRPGSS